MQILAKLQPEEERVPPTAPSAAAAAAASVDPALQPLRGEENGVKRKKMRKRVSMGALGATFDRDLPNKVNWPVFCAIFDRNNAPFSSFYTLSRLLLKLWRCEMKKHCIDLLLDDDSLSSLRKHLRRFFPNASEREISSYQMDGCWRERMVMSVCTLQAWLKKNAEVWNQSPAAFISGMGNFSPAVEVCVSWLD